MRRFLFEGSHLRGVRVHLTDAWQALLARHPYPGPVVGLLGQSLAAVSLLGATIKFDGSLIMQMSGDGPLAMLVVQATGARTVRGMASLRDTPHDATLAALLGKGHLAMTIDPGTGKERYQGIVGLEGDRLAHVLDGYFANSEQLPTRLWLAADAQHAAGLLLQALPSDDPDTRTWERLTMMADTVKPDELLTLGSRSLLRRLFVSDQVRLFDPEAIAFECRCSRERVSGMLRTMSLAELLETAEEEGGALKVSCDFCNATYSFDPVDLQALFVEGADAPPPSDQTH